MATSATDPATKAATPSRETSPGRTGMAPGLPATLDLAYLGPDGLDALQDALPAAPADPEVSSDGPWDEDLARLDEQLAKAGIMVRLSPRSASAGPGFAAAAADAVPPGLTLAGLAADAWDAGPRQLTDDQLAGLILAWRRLSSWSAAGELAAVAELGRRRNAQVAAGADPHLAEHVSDELAAQARSPLTVPRTRQRQRQRQGAPGGPARARRPRWPAWSAGWGPRESGTSGRGAAGAA